MHYLVGYLSDHGVRVLEDIFITGFGNWRTVEKCNPSIIRMRTNLPAEKSCVDFKNEACVGCFMGSTLSYDKRIHGGCGCVSWNFARNCLYETKKTIIAYSLLNFGTRFGCGDMERLAEPPPDDGFDAVCR